MDLWNPKNYCIHVLLQRCKIWHVWVEKKIMIRKIKYAKNLRTWLFTGRISPFFQRHWDKDVLFKHLCDDGLKRVLFSIMISRDSSDKILYSKQWPCCWASCITVCIFISDVCCCQPCPTTLHDDTKGCWHTQRNASHFCLYSFDLTALALCHVVLTLK